MFKYECGPIDFFHGCQTLGEWLAENESLSRGEIILTGKG